MEIYTIGGFNEVGKNMTVVVTKDGEDAFMFDCGLFLPPIVELEEREKASNEKTLRTIGALPYDFFLDSKGIREKIDVSLAEEANVAFDHNINMIKDFND